MRDAPNAVPLTAPNLPNIATLGLITGPVCGIIRRLYSCKSATVPTSQAEAEALNSIMSSDLQWLLLRVRDTILIRFLILTPCIAK